MQDEYNFSSSYSIFKFTHYMATQNLPGPLNLPKKYSFNIECLKCDYRTRKFIYLKYHFEKNNQSILYLCDQCNYKAKAKLELKNT